MPGPDLLLDIPMREHVAPTRVHAPRRKPVRQPRPVQLAIPMPAQPPRKRESAALHAAVVALRKAGHQVYRAGNSAMLVDGRRVAHKWVHAMARAVAARGAQHG